MKLVDEYTYLGNIISSTEMDFSIYLANACNAIESLLIIWRFLLFDKIKRDSSNLYLYASHGH